MESIELTLTQELRLISVQKDLKGVPVNLSTVEQLSHIIADLTRQNFAKDNIIKQLLKEKYGTQLGTLRDS